MTAAEIPSGSIIVAVDGSDEANRAVTWAAHDALLEGRPLAAVEATGQQRGSARTVADAVALAFRESPGIEVHGVQLAGEPSDVLIELSQHAHLIVMGSRGRGVLSSSLLGSVGAAVCAHAACPVVVCRPTDEPFTKTVLVVGADGSDDALPVIEFAFRQASLRAMPLDVVHCYVEPATRGWRSGRPVDKGSLRLQLAKSVAALAEKFPEVHVSLRLDNDRVAEALNRGARPRELVIVGRRPAHSHSRFTHESEALEVLERSESAVAVVPEAGIAPLPINEGEPS